MASACAASSGAIFSSRSLVKSLLSAEDLLKNTVATRCRVRPDCSSGIIVFSKVGMSRRLVMFWISASCSSKPAVKAGS